MSECAFLCFFKNILFIFLERGEGWKKEKERNINVWLPLMLSPLGTWPATQACALTRNLTGDLPVHRPALNPLSCTSQGCFSVFLQWNTCVIICIVLNSRSRTSSITLVFEIALEFYNFAYLLYGISLIIPTTST